MIHETKRIEGGAGGAASPRRGDGPFRSARLGGGASGRRLLACLSTDRRSVSRWMRMYERGGEGGLDSKPQRGPTPGLSSDDLAALEGELLKGPREHGFKTELWTLARVAKVIESEFGIGYHPCHVWKILGAHAGRAIARRWSDAPRRGLVGAETRATSAGTGRSGRPRVAREGMAPYQKGARRGGRSIVFIDESGPMLQPVVRRTWSPRGETPIIKSWDRRDRLSAVSALTIPPLRRRLGLHFDVLDHNVRWPDAYRFLSSLLSKLRRPITVVLDRLNAHRSAIPRLKERFGSRVEVEWLPPYAPELNPVEGVWCHTKHDDLANYIPEDVDDLNRNVERSLRRTRTERDLLRSFFEGAGLEL